jgi:DNA invertase Pin-like site-specific DNA recombinase
MATGKHVAYYRVSTAKQGRSGLGLDAQRLAVRTFLNGGLWDLIGEVVEVESGRGSDNRPQLQEALRLCRTTGATLIVAKLDRLSRNAAFLMELQNSGAAFVAADMPGANSFTVGVMALVAQQERESISHRTKDALAAAKARGVKLGGNRGHTLPAKKAAAKSALVRTQSATKRARDIIVSIQHARDNGAQSLRQIAAYLNETNTKAARGGTWSAAQVRRVINTDFDD